MFLWRNADVLWVTLQTDHMVQVREIAGAWGNERFPGPRRRGAFLAARLHDEGWGEIDHRPEFDDETGLPVELTGKVFGSVFGSSTMPASHYGRGVDLLLSLDKYAALLASMHGTGVYLRDYGIDGQPVPDRERLKPEARAFLETHEKLQANLKGETGAGDEEVWHDFRLLIAWNRLSQIFSRGLTDVSLSRVPTVDRPEGVDIRAVRVNTLTVSLDPYPFHEEPGFFPVRTYSAPYRRYASREEFLSAVAAVPSFSAVYRAVRR